MKIGWHEESHKPTIPSNNGRWHGAMKDFVPMLCNGPPVIHAPCCAQRGLTEMKARSGAGGVMWGSDSM